VPTSRGCCCSTRCSRTLWRDDRHHRGVRPCGWRGCATTRPEDMYHRCAIRTGESRRSRSSGGERVRVHPNRADAYMWSDR
jgi:hypothetical protein